MNHFLFLFYFLTLHIFLMSCESNIENADYREGKGYCVKKYDKKGCNICDFEHIEYNRHWSCTDMACEKTNEEKADKCLRHKKKL